LKQLRTRNGVSLLELIVTITILGILAAGVMPLIRNTTIRTKEIELRRNLRIIRIAIDDFKKTYDKVPAGIGKPMNKSGYPETLQVLVEGHDFQDSAQSGEVKFLRRPVLNPLDPKSSTDDNWGWGLRSYEDKFDTTNWGKQDVFDVYAPQDGTALDGTKYNEW